MTRDSVVLKKIRVLLARKEREQLINKQVFSEETYGFLC